MKNELEKIALLAAKFGKPPSGVGIGDDCAVLGGKEDALVWTIDAQVEGTHFKLDWLSWRDVGWRSFMAAASDLAAMGAVPVAALSALVLVPSLSDDALAELAEGQAAAAKALGTSIVGGNLARGTETSITTTLLGRVARPILRSGAKVGDGVWLAGKVGFAATGFAALQQNADPVVYAKCIDSWRRPRARIDLRDVKGVPEATAAIDVSDGLARDAMHLADASGVTLALDSAALVLPPRLDKDPLEYALHGGEDYAIVLTSAEPLPPPLTRIGTVIARGKAPVILDGAPVEARGFDHFVQARH